MITESIYLTHILFILAAAVLTVPIFHRLGLGSVIGYLAAGAIIGPWGFGFISQVQEINHIAEFGVVFLLFIIGIELNFTRLLSIRHMILGLGTYQLVITAASLAVVAFFLGIPKESAIIIGFGLALSSTAFVLQILTERNEFSSTTGRASFSILLLQDIAVVPLLTLVSFLAHETILIEGTKDTFIEIALIIATIAAVVIVGRFILTPALRLIAISRNAEVFIAATVLVVLGTAWLMEQVGLSMALGAFLAGLMLADSYYRHQIVSDIQPFRGILLGLFFMSVGMSVDFGLLAQKWLLIIELVILLLTIKILILWLLCRLTKMDNGTSIRTSMLLSQSGEFGLVIFGLAATAGLITTDLFHMLTLIIAISMVTTPLMAIAGEYIEKVLRIREIQGTKEDIQTDTCNFIIIVGFGRVGKRIAKILDTGNIPYLAMDNDPDLVKKEQYVGFSVIYGDANRYDVLKSMGAEHACATIITIDKAPITEQLVYLIHKRYPKMPIYARGRNKEHCKKLQKAGASMPVSETLEVSLKLGGAALSIVGTPSEEVSRILQDYREIYYEDEPEYTKPY